MILQIMQSARRAERAAAPEYRSHARETPEREHFIGQTTSTWRRAIERPAILALDP